VKQSKARRAADRIRQWREDPLLFVREQFGVEPDPWQKDVLQVFPTNRRIAMKACKGPGKTAVLAWCCWNFLSTRPSPKIAATSITGDNLSDNLWPEMAKWQGRSDFLKESFVWTKTRIFNKQAPENWFMSARTWPKSGDSTQQADTLAGLHADYLLFVLDESGGIPDAVMAAAEAGLASGVETKILQAGNPTHLEGPLYRASTSERNLWYVINITGDPDNPNRSSRVSVQWAREQIEKYGRDNPWVKVNVFGEFPPASLNALFSADDIDAAMKRSLREVDYQHAQKRIGIDVARFGDDKCILFPRQGRKAFTPDEHRNINGIDLAAAIAAKKSLFGSEQEMIDDTGGYAASAIDQLGRIQLYPMPVNFSSKATDPRYANRRAEMYFNMAQWIKTASLPNLPNLKRQLLAITYMFQGNRMILEDKEQIKQKLQGESPDEADSLALTFALPELDGAGADGVRFADGSRLTPAGLYIPSSGRALTEFDPFREAA
jgi:phage terminase large subunit